MDHNINWQLRNMQEDIEQQLAKNSDWRKPAMRKGYDQQLLAARQLARFRVRKRLEANESIEDPDPSINRNQKMRVVSRELYQNLLFTGTADSFLEDLRVDFSNILGLKLEFAYPPGKRMCLMVREKTGLRYLTPEEWNKLGDLQTLTSQIVDQKMQKTIT